MQLEASYVTALEQCVQSLVESRSPSDIFKILLKGSQSAAPRGAVFLVRQGAIKGWGSIGYDENVARSQRGYRADATSGWLGELVSNPETGLQVRENSGDPDFGQAAPSDSAAIGVRVRGRTIAVLTAERSAGDTLWVPEGLKLIVAVAQLRLELDLALRRLKSGPPAAAATPAEPTPAAEPVVAPPAMTVTATPSAVEPPPVVEVALDFDADEESATEVAEVLAPGAENAELAAAKRFAKLVATDIRLYNEEAVMNGRREGDLAERLGEQIGRGKDTFMKRHASMGSAASKVLHEAFVEVLAAGDRNLLPESVLD
jgi:hypothetical protein